MLKLEVKD